MADTVNNLENSYYQKKNHIRLAKSDVTKPLILDSAQAKAAALGVVITSLAVDSAPVISGAPTISGTEIENQTLTASAASAVGNPSPTRTWQWERSGVAISGATSSTYTLVAADVGETLTVVQTETNSEGSDTAESAATGAIVAAAVPVISGVPTISGTETEDEVLTATAASVTGSPTPTRTWQWERSNVAISGATSSTYTLVSPDVGENITVVQTETNAEGVDTAESAATGVIAGAPFTPAISGVPTISGTETEDEVLTATAASVTGNPTPTRTWQWERSGVAISGATSSTYTLVAADVGETITVVQTETNSEGSDTAESAATGVIVDASFAPSISGVPTISGTETEGEVLTATASSVTGNPTPTRTWQWERSGVAISGATSSTYTLVAADVGETITVVQTETNSEGSDTAESAATGAIVASGGGSFDPADLFASGEKGFFHDMIPENLNTLSTNAGSTPGLGDPIGYAEDLSGNAVHSTQPTAAFRLALRQTGGGLYYAELDGADDLMVGVGGWAVSSTLTIVISGFIASSAVINNDGLITINVPGGGREQRGMGTPGTTLKADVRGFNVAPPELITSACVMEAEFPAAGAAGVIKAAVNGGTFSNSPSFTPLNTSQNYSIGVGLIDVRIPASIFSILVIDRALTAGERTDLLNWMATRGGVTL